MLLTVKQIVHPNVSDIMEDLDGYGYEILSTSKRF